MNYKLLFENIGLFTLEEYLKYAQNNFYYGWIDKNGETHFGVNSANNYSLQSPDELLNSKVGICWDLTELSRAFFDSMTDFKFETYYLFYDDGAGCPSHTFLVLYNDKSFYYFSGIHKFDSVETLLSKAISIFLANNVFCGNIPENYSLSNIFLYKYVKPKYHINGYEMREHINLSEKIGVSYDRKSI